MSNKTVQEYLTSIEKSLDGIVTACKGFQKTLFVGIQLKKNGRFCKFYLT